MKRGRIQAGAVSFGGAYRGLSWPSALLAILLAVAGPAAPQEPETEAEDADGKTLGIEELQITAPAGQGMAQDMPVSVQSFDAAELEAAQITDIRDLADYTPNLEIKVAIGASNPTLFIRGIGLNDFNSNASSSVAVYADGVYMNSPAGQLFQLFDVETVDVLRGPQGSLHGRNATAGAIEVYSKKPDGEFGADALVTYGNYNALEITGAVSIPLIPDVLSARIAGRFNQRDGIVNNRCGGSIINEFQPRLGVKNQCRRTNRQVEPIPSGLPGRVNDVDNWAARAIVAFEPSADQEWLLNVHAGQSMADVLQLQFRGVRAPIVNGQGTGSLDYRDWDLDPYTGDYDLVEPENLDLFGTSLTGNVMFDSVTLKSVTGYEYNKRSILDNTDASPRILAHSDINDSAWQVSQELNLASQWGGRFEWEAGVFFLYEELEARNVYDSRVVSSIRTLTRQDYDQDLLTWAVYGHATYELTDQLSVDAGIRYNWERKSFNIFASHEAFAGVGIPVTAIGEKTEETWSKPTGDLVFTWQPTDGLSTYAKYSRGFKGGHFNAGAVFSAQLVEAVEPETINAYEVGLKSTWFDGRLVFNTAFFYYDYKNYQVFALRNDPGAIPFPQLLNAPKVTSRGLEMDVQMEPVDGLFLNAALGLLDAEFTEFSVLKSFRDQTGNCPVPPRCPVVFEEQDFSGNPVVAAPDLSLTLVAYYEIGLGGWGTLTPRVDASYKSKVYFEPGDTTKAPAEPLEEATQDGFWLLHGRLAYRTPNDKVEIAGWVRNALDEAYLVDSFDLRDSLSAFLDVYSVPRTYGLSVSFQW